MQTIVDKQKNLLLKKFHTLLGVAGIDQENKGVILGQYGGESSRDLTINQLMEVCSLVEGMIHPEIVETNMWRRRVLATIGSWLRKLGKDNNIDIIKAIACRASGNAKFNDITTDRLRSLYYAFGKKVKDLNFAERATLETINELISSN